MKRRAIFSLVVFVFSGICLTGCAAPRSPGDTEARLQNLENKVASYSGLSARVMRTTSSKSHRLRPSRYAHSYGS